MGGKQSTDSVTARPSTTGEELASLYWTGTGCEEKFWRKDLPPKEREKIALASDIGNKFKLELHLHREEMRSAALNGKTRYPLIHCNKFSSPKATKPEKCAQFATLLPEFQGLNISYTPDLHTVPLGRLDEDETYEPGILWASWEHQLNKSK